ncbi:Fic family protein [Actinoallomurus sp. NPDC052274]|uniref:Fic/DOC family protein n=1 Tax=Actinoallomurus sp. NPDC052274 TaxID=3155420 RepID=UPI0034326600
MSFDPYIDPATGVLKNKLGCDTHEALRQAERDITRAALIRLAVRPVVGAYDLDHLCAFHRAVFGDIYEWAGEVRTVTIAKGDVFCLPQFIPSEGERIFGSLAKEEFLVGLRRRDFVDRLTYYFGEINALHPFRERNGRTQRAFLGQLTREAGFAVRWARMDAARNVAASIAIMRGDPAPMRRMMDELVEPV